MEEVHGRPRMMWMDVVGHFDTGEHKKKARENTNEQGVQHVDTRVNDGFSQRQKTEQQTGNKNHNKHETKSTKERFTEVCSTRSQKVKET